MGVRIAIFVDVLELTGGMICADDQAGGGVARIGNAGDVSPGIGRVGGVYAEWCDQGMSCYGCIRSFDLYPQRIRATFTEEADFYVLEGVEEVSERRRLTELVVTFTLDAVKFAELKGRLSFIFKDCDCYAVHEVDATTSA